MLLETLMNNDAPRSQPFLAARQHHTALFCKHYPLAYTLTKIRVFQFFDTKGPIFYLVLLFEDISAMLFFRFPLFKSKTLQICLRTRPRTIKLDTKPLL